MKGEKPVCACSDRFLHFFQRLLAQKSKTWNVLLADDREGGEHETSGKNVKSIPTAKELKEESRSMCALRAHWVASRPLSRTQQSLNFIWLSNAWISTRSKLWKLEREIRTDHCCGCRHCSRLLRTLKRHTSTSNHYQLNFFPCCRSLRFARCILLTR